MHRLTVLALVAPILAAPTPTAAQQVVKFGASYTGDVLASVDGGIDDGLDLVGRADAWVDFDGAAVGLPAIGAHVDLMAAHGPDFSGRRTGVYQTISSVEADTAPHVYEAWTQWQASPAFWAKAGLIDLNAEFDVQNTGTLFVNSAFGIGPDISQSGLAGPSIFPMTTSALVLRAQHGRKSFALGVFDALAGARHDPRKLAVRLPGETGALLIAETKVPIGTWLLQVGGWHYTTRFDAINPAGKPAVSNGAYGMVEGVIVRGVSAWLRAGIVDARANPIAAYVGGGAVATLGEWRLGLAAAHARLGNAARRTLYAPARAQRAETLFELTVQRAVTPWLQVQPDVQYVIHPGWDRTVPNAL
ncbi:MAG: carbohydrate porin, partial [Novosphingobium sp.]